MSDPDEVSQQPTLVAPAGLTQPSAISEDETRPVFGQRYEVISLLGSGGMGTVYMARDSELDEIVALKVLRNEALTTPGALEMFRREVKLARRVTHPNVARTFDIGEAEGSRYLTMEYVEGTSLGRVIDRGARMPIGRVVMIAEQMAAGLAAAHAVGIVHRDLKPDNVILQKNDRIAITDFGIAKPVESGSVTVTMGIAVGTPAYMSPEQVEARRDIDGRADIYAFGVVLYELLTGELPFIGDSALAVAAQRLVKPPPDVRAQRPDVPDGLAELVLRCMAKNRDDRFSSIEQVSAALATMTAPIALPSIAARPITMAPLHKAVAVLPFRNVGAKEDGFTADGLWDDLIDALSMTQGLRVRPRSSLSRFENAENDPRAVGKELGVDVVVEGTMRRNGDTLRVTVRLINVVDGFQLWAKRFDRASRDIFALSDEIAEAVARAVTLERDVPLRDAPVDTVAMDLYLKARLEYRRLFTGGADAAAALYEQSLARAPDDPTILAGYAIVQVRRWFFGKSDAVVPARAAAEKALELAPHLVEARYALGLLKLHSGDHRGAIADLHAIVSRADSSLAHETLAGILSEIGLPEESRFHIDRALKVDPESPLAHMELGRFYALKGMWDEVDLTMDRMRNTGVSMRDGLAGTMRFAFWRGGITEEAARSFSGNLGPIGTEIFNVALRSDASRLTSPEAFVNSASSGSMRRSSLVYQIEAETACFKGDGAWAIDAVERAIASGLIDIAWLRLCPLLHIARNEPRYSAVERTIAARATELVAFYRSL